MTELALLLFVCVIYFYLWKIFIGKNLKSFALSSKGQNPWQKWRKAINNYFYVLSFNSVIAFITGLGIFWFLARLQIDWRRSKKRRSESIIDEVFFG